MDPLPLRLALAIRTDDERVHWIMHIVRFAQPTILARDVITSQLAGGRGWIDYRLMRGGRWATRLRCRMGDRGGVSGPTPALASEVVHGHPP